MNRNQAINIVATHLAELMGDSTLEEVTGIPRSRQELMSTEDLALLDDARQIVVKRLYAMAQRTRPSLGFNADLPYRVVLTVNGHPSVHGPYKNGKTAASTGKMWARRALQPHAPFGPFPAVSVQVQKHEGEDWVDVGDPIVEMAAQ
jgi:hypothetical protein